MAKIDTTYQARMDGMNYALRVAEEDGVEALRKEIEFRNENFVPLEINRRGLQEIYGMLAGRIIQTMLTMMLATLRDTNRFGEKRLKEFKVAFDKKCKEVDALDPYGEHYARISDYAQMLKEECNIDLDLKTILKIQEDTDKNDERLRRND